MFRPWLVVFLLHVSSAVVVHHEDEKLSPTAAKSAAGSSSLVRREQPSVVTLGAANKSASGVAKYLVGCFRDNGYRDLQEFKGHISTERCMEACAGYKYFAQQAASECRCGNSYGKYGRRDDCACDNWHIGGWRNCVYKTPSECPAGNYLFAHSTCKECLGDTRRRRAYTCTDCASNSYRLDGKDTCKACAGGVLRRRRASACTPCSAGFYSIAGETCSRCVGGEVRRRRARSCDPCPTRQYSKGTMDACTVCSKGEVRRRRSVSCEACPITDYSSASSDACKQPDE